MKPLFLGMVLLMVGLLSSCATQGTDSTSERARPAKVVGDLVLDPSVPFPQKRTVGAVWLTYLMARSSYIADHEDAYVGRIGRTEPLFAEEVRARTAAAKSWLEFRAKGDAYLDQLASVHEAGFIPHYVWTYFRQPDWAASEAPADLQKFQAWVATNLPNHVPETYGTVRVTLPRH